MLVIVNTHTFHLETLPLLSILSFTPDSFPILDKASHKSAYSWACFLLFLVVIENMFSPTFSILSSLVFTPHLPSKFLILNQPKSHGPQDLTQSEPPTLLPL